MAKSTASNSSQTIFLILGIVIFVALISLLFSYTPVGCSKFTKTELNSTANLIISEGKESFQSSDFDNVLSDLNNMLYNAFTGPSEAGDVPQSILYTNFIKPYKIENNPNYSSLFSTPDINKVEMPDSYYYVGGGCLFVGVDNIDYINYLSKFTYASNLKDLYKLVQKKKAESSNAPVAKSPDNSYFKMFANNNTVLLNSALRKTIEFREQNCNHSNLDVLDVNLYEDK